MPPAMPVLPHVRAGQSLRAVQARGCIARELLLPREPKLPAHSHGTTCIALILEGEVVMRSDGDERAYRPGEVGIVPAGIGHDHRLGPRGLRFCHIELHDFQLPAEVALALCGLRTVVHCPATDLVRRVYTELRRADTASPVAIDGIVLEFLAGLLRERTSPREGSWPAWLRDLRNLIDRQPAMAHSLTEMARLAGVHPVHVSRTFRKFCGCSMGQYIRQQRIALATRLLDDRTPIGLIAQHTGFCDQAHFSRVFKQIVGCAPGEYRRLRPCRRPT